MPRLFHVSDLHFGCADEAALAWFAEAVRAERPDAVAVTGDLTMRARTAEFEAATRWLESLDVPLTIEPGNHDLPWKAQSARSCDFGHVEEQRLNMAIYQARSCPPIS